MKKAMVVGALVLTAALAQETRTMIYHTEGAIAGPMVQGSEVFAFKNLEFTMNGAPVKGAPYSADAITETTQTLADGNRIHRTTKASLYRDSEGRTRREQTLGEVGSLTTSGEPLRTIVIHDPVAGVTYMMDSHSNVAHKLPSGAETAVGGKVMAEMKAKAEKGMARGGAVFATAGPAGDVAYSVQVKGKAEDERRNLKTESLGTQMIEGVAADGTRTTMTIPAGAVGNEQPINVVTERWYSSQLQTTVMTKTTDPRMGETVYKLQNIKLTEPSPDLFTVPADYTLQQ